MQTLVGLAEKVDSPACGGWIRVGGFPPRFKVNGQLEDFMMPGGQCVNDGWDQDEFSPINVNADGWLVGFILAVACRIYPRLVSDPCTSPQLSKVVTSTVRKNSWARVEYPRHAF